MEEDELLDEIDDGMDFILATTESHPEPEPPARISVEEMIIEQQTDELCREVRDKIHSGKETLFFEDESTGVLSRNYKDCAQEIVPRSLRQHLLHIAHISKAGGHAGGRRMYKTLRRTFYWPAMDLEEYIVVCNCHACAKEPVQAQKRSKFLKLFPAAAPLEEVAKDLLGELVETPQGNKHLLVITDRFTKLVKIVPLRNIRAQDIARAFLRHWVFAYGARLKVLIDNGPQFTAKFLLETHRVFGIQELFTTAYHPETNGQTERYTRTILSALRKFVGEHPQSWD